MASTFLQNSLPVSGGCPDTSRGRTGSSSSQPDLSYRAGAAARMTLQSSEGCPGLGTDVFAPQSPQEAEDESRSERKASELEHTWDLETPDLPPLLPMALWGSQVWLRSWREGS